MSNPDSILSDLDHLSFTQTRSSGGGGGGGMNINVSDSIHLSNIIEFNYYKYSFLLYLKQINFTNCNKTTDTNIEPFSKCFEL